MVTIDRELGGTAPIDIVLDADPAFFASQTAYDDGDDEFDDAFDDAFDDEFASEFDNDTRDLGASSYWYNNYRLAQLREVHDYLDSLPETGKVLSLATTIEMLEILNQDETPGTFFLSVLYNRLPVEIKTALFDPYMSADGNQVRLSARVFDSDPELRRGELIARIRTHLIEELGFQPEQVHVTGMLVLYNNVLQSLYRSQVLTLGAVLVAIMLMFALLFRSLRVAAAAILPSALSVVCILGAMGLAGVPLDIMTITIAAISVGIGVDDSIHYIHRYRNELAIDGDPVAAMRRSHASVGSAMFYTSVIVMVGFFGAGAVELHSQHSVWVVDGAGDVAGTGGQPDVVADSVALVERALKRFVVFFPMQCACLVQPAVTLNATRQARNKLVSALVVFVRQFHEAAEVDDAEHIEFLFQFGAHTLDQLQIVVRAIQIEHRH